MREQLFMTQRAKVLALYKKAGQEFLATTFPYHSVRQVVFDVVHGTALTHSYAIARKAQQPLDFFSYGIGEVIPKGEGSGPATEADTNLANGKSTNGASDFIIEGVGLGCRGAFIRNDAAQNGAILTPAGVTDTEVLNALQGVERLFDPGAVIAPPQLHSPFNLENAMFQALLPHLALEFEFDREKTHKLGAVDLLPQAGAASYLRSNGVPSSENRWRIPEGFLWRRDGEPDSEFIARLTLKNSVTIPLTNISIPGAVAAFPRRITLEIQMRAFGLQVKLPSQN